MHSPPIPLTLFPHDTALPGFLLKVRNQLPGASSTRSSIPKTDMIKTNSSWSTHDEQGPLMMNKLDGDKTKLEDLNKPGTLANLSNTITY